MDDCLTHLQATDKANILNHQYHSVYTREDPSSATPDPDGTPLPDMDNITVTEQGVKKLLQKSNRQKATGPDMIPARILRECSEELAPILTIVFNKMLQTGCVPEDWKQANVSAVFKKGQRYNPANYRPVSLTCLCCTIVYRTIRDHADQEALQEDLVRLAEWEDKWGMEFHPQKCSTLSVTRSRSPLKYPYQLKGHTLEVQDTTMYLGVDLQSTLSWKNHIDRITKKSNSMLGFLRRN